MKIVDAEVLARVLRGRAEMARNNARTYAAAGYPGEALINDARAKAYDQALLDAEEAATEVAL